ncbi:MAG: AAA family ATPase [Actinomycetota bacterium]
MAVAKRASKRPDFPSLFEELVDSVDGAIRGKDEEVRQALTCLIAEGHLLIEDVPGVGKTLLAKAMARAMGLEHRRIQFTPDLLPADVTGSSIYDQRSKSFSFHEGPIFANIVLGDEINRASPKTQSSLLEAMEERTVTIDGQMHHLPQPFLVIATQNPIEHEGTYPLPFAQMDRFLMRLTLGYPSPSAEIEVLERHADGQGTDEVAEVCGPDEILAMAKAARTVFVSPAVHEYIVTLVGATRDLADLELGASPRAGLALVRAGRVRAASEGRDYLSPDDVKALAVSVLAHRLVLAPDAEFSGRSAVDLVNDLLSRVPVPVGA